MTIKERYQKLSECTPSETTIDEVKMLKIDCAKENNLQYMYYCDLLLCDIYTENNNEEEALNISLKNLNLIDANIFKTIYASFLERIIYIYIRKNKYKLAYKYSNMKVNYIDIKNSDEINRWYLETAYIYAELNYKDKTIENLEKITQNTNDETLLSLVYSNLTKLYIDINNIQKAKETLNNCLELVFKLDDPDGKAYCDYLLAKLYCLDNNYSYAIKTYSELFKGMKHPTEEYLSISLEYVNTLIEALEIDEASKILNKYKVYYEKSSDIYLKKDYYKCLLKSVTYKNKYIKDSIPTIIAKIEGLESKIEQENNRLLTENSDDVSFEIFSKLKETNDKFEKTIERISRALINNSIRSALTDFGKALNSISEFDEFQLLIFDQSKFTPIIQLYQDFDVIEAYQYKKERLYERSYNYQSLSNTVFELIIANQQELVFDIKTNSLQIIDLIKQKTFFEINVKYLIALPLFSNNDLYGAILYTSSNNDICDSQNLIAYKMATKMLESKLLSLFYLENLNTQKNILQNAVNALQEGIYYNNPYSDNLVLTPKSQEFLHFSNEKISKKDLYDLIDQEEFKNYKKILDESFANKKNYKVNYHATINGERKIIEEVASLYSSNDGTILFYIVALHELSFLSNPIIKDNLCLDILKQSDFDKKFSIIKSNTKTIEYKFSLLRFGIKDLDKISDINLKSQIIKEIHLKLANAFLLNTYFLSDNTFAIFIENHTDLSVINELIENAFEEIKKGIIIDENLYVNDLYCSIVRYPRDTYNVDDVVRFSTLSLDEHIKIQVFNDDIYKSFLKKETIKNLVKTRMQTNSIELMLLELENTLNNEKSYEVKYNIKGLTSKENVNNFLEGEFLLNFEKEIFIKLLRIVDSIDGNLYVNMSVETMDYLFNKKIINTNNKSKYNKICLLISHYSENYKTVIEKSLKFGFKVFIDYKFIDKVSYLWLVNANITGMMINEAIAPTLRNKVLSLISILDIDIFANYKFPDYQKIIFRTDNLHKIEEVIK